MQSPGDASEPTQSENHIWTLGALRAMSCQRTLQAMALLLAIAAILSAAPSALAVGYSDVVILERYTQEGDTTTVPLVLNGTRVLEAYFNFSVTDDVLSSQPDSFTFTVSNVEEPSVRQSMPGTTDQSGLLSVSLPFTRTASTHWRVEVKCTVAGDKMIGPIVRQPDGGNAWELQVEYVYETPSDGGGGDGGGGGGGGGSSGQPLLLKAFDANLLVVALLSLTVTMLAVRGRRPGGRLVPSYGLGAFILFDVLLAMPVAMLINLQENGVTISKGAPGPAWLGDLSIALLVVWLVPFLVTFHRVMTSDVTKGVLARWTSDGFAGRMRRVGRRVGHDPLTHTRVADLLAGIGVASAVIAVAMVLVM
jgi:uncharacterized membrane protein YgcG